MGFFNTIGNLFKKKEEKSNKTYDLGLSKTRQTFTSKLLNLTSKYDRINEDYYDELEEILIGSDIGVKTVINFMDRLKDRASSEKITDPKILKDLIVDELFVIYVEGEYLKAGLELKGKPAVILFVGVNGVGKTTSIAKIAHQLISEGKKVKLVGADTFRAGAREQLENWSEKVGASFFTLPVSDPSAVIHQAIDEALTDNTDVLLIDTAGRLQNKDNLMQELAKMKRVINNKLPGEPSETLLVIDATTGQNGIVQAKAFKEITDLTGIILSKLDGSAKGGIVLAIKEETGLPVKYIGLGEGMEDLKLFDIEEYIYSLFKDIYNG